MNERVEVLVKGVFRAFVTKVLSAVIVFLFFATLTRFFSVTDVGEFIGNLSYLMFVALIVRFGVDQAVVRESALSNFEPLTFGLSFIFAFTAILFIVDYFFKFDLKLYIFLAFLIALLQLLSSYIKGAGLIAFGLFAQNGLYQIFFMGILFLSILINQQADIETYFIISLIVSVSTILIFVLFRLPCSISWKIPYSAYFRLLLPFFLNNLMQLVLLWGGVSYIKLVLDNEAVAIYGIVSRCVVFFGFIFVAFNSVLLPEVTKAVSRKEYNYIESLFGLTLKLCVLVGSIAYLLLYVLGEWILSIFGSAYVSGFNLMLVLALGQLGIVFAGPSLSFLIASGHERLVSKSLMISVSVFLFLLIPLTKEFNVSGVAFSTSLANLIYSIYIYSKAKKILRSGV